MQPHSDFRSFPPFPHPFVLKPFCGVYMLLIGHEICRSALWALFILWSLLYQYTSVCIRSTGGEVPQERIKKETRSHFSWDHFLSREALWAPPALLTYRPVWEKSLCKGQSRRPYSEHMMTHSTLPSLFSCFFGLQKLKNNNKKKNCPIWQLTGLV